MGKLTIGQSSTSIFKKLASGLKTDLLPARAFDPLDEDPDTQKYEIGALPYNPDEDPSYDEDELKALHAQIRPIVHNVEPLGVCLRQMLRSDEITNDEITEILSAPLLRLKQTSQDHLRKEQTKDKSITDKDVECNWPSSCLKALLLELGLPKDGFPISSFPKQIGYGNAQHLKQCLEDMEETFHGIILAHSGFSKEALPADKLGAMYRYALYLDIYNEDCSFSDWFQTAYHEFTNSGIADIPSGSGGSGGSSGSDSDNDDDDPWRGRGPQHNPDLDGVSIA